MTHYFMSGSSLFVLVYIIYKTIFYYFFFQTISSFISQFTLCLLITVVDTTICQGLMLSNVISWQCLLCTVACCIVEWWTYFFRLQTPFAQRNVRFNCSPVDGAVFISARCFEHWSCMKCKFYFIAHEKCPCYVKFQPRVL